MRRRDGHSGIEPEQIRVVTRERERSRARLPVRYEGARPTAVGHRMRLDDGSYDARRPAPTCRFLDAHAVRIQLGLLKASE